MRLRKLISAAIFCMYTSTAWAVDTMEGITAIGKVVYKIPAGELVFRDVELDVPARGEGPIVLRGNNIELSSTKYSSRTIDGRTVFVVVFENAPGAPAGSYAVFYGSYMRGTNAAVWYGDIWTFSHPVEPETFVPPSGGANEGRPLHKGGFMFKARVESPAPSPEPTPKTTSMPIPMPTSTSTPPMPMPTAVPTPTP